MCALCPDAFSVNILNSILRHYSKRSYKGWSAGDFGGEGGREETGVCTGVGALVLKNIKILRHEKVRKAMGNEQIDREKESEKRESKDTYKILMDVQVRKGKKGGWVWGRYEYEP